MLTRSISNQAMHRSTSFRALVLFGIVALVTALYQLITPPSSALTIPTGLMPRHSALKPGPFSSLGIRYSSGASPFAPPTPPLARGRSGPSSPLTHAYRLLTNRSFSNGAAEAAPKTVGGWSNALDGPGLFDIDAPNEDQCGLFDVGAPTNDQRGPLDAPDNNQCAPNKPVVASPKAFELTDPVHRHHSRYCPECSS